MSKKIEKFLLIIIKIFLYLTLLTPFIISKTTLFPFVFGKAIVFQILVETVLVFYLILILINKQYLPNFTKRHKWKSLPNSIDKKHYNLKFISPKFIFWLIAFYIIILLLAALTSQDISLSFWGTQERMTGVFSIMHFFVYFIILVGVLKIKKDWLNLLRTQAGVVFIFGIITLIKTKFLTSIPYRYDATFGNPDIIGSYLLLSLFIIIILWVLDNNKLNKDVNESLNTESYKNEHKKIQIKNVFWRVFYSFSLVFAVLGLILAGTRAAYTGIFFGFLCFFFLYVFLSSQKKLQSKNSLTKKLICGLNYRYFFTIIAVLIVFLIAGLFLIFGILGKLPSKITEIEFTGRILSIPLSLGELFSAEGDSNTRILSWKAGIIGFKEKPILGWGPENYSLAFNKYISLAYFENYSSSSYIQFDKAHNKFFEVLTETGILGLISYLCIFLISFLFLLKRKNNLSFFLISLLVAYFIQNLFTFDTPSSYLLFFLSLATICSFDKLRQKKEIIKNQEFFSRELKAWQFIGVILLFLIIPWLSYIGTIKPYFASRQSAMAQVSWGKLNTQKFSLALYQKVLAYHTFVSNEATQFLCKQVVNIASTPNFKLTEDFKNHIKICSDNLEKKIKKNIFHYQDTVLIGKLYSLLSNFDPLYLDKAETILKQAILYAPLRFQLYSDLGLILRRQKKYQESLDNFNKAIELKGSQAYNFWQIAMAYLEQEKFKEAIDFIEKAKAVGYNYNNLADISSIAFTYSRLNDWDKALVYYQNALSLDPQNIEILGALALVYKEQGNKVSARATAEKISEISPEAKNSVEEFLKGL